VRQVLAGFHDRPVNKHIKQKSFAKNVSIRCACLGMAEYACFETNKRALDIWVSKLLGLVILPLILPQAEQNTFLRPPPFFLSNIIFNWPLWTFPWRGNRPAVSDRCLILRVDQSRLSRLPLLGNESSVANHNPA